MFMYILIQLDGNCGNLAELEIESRVTKFSSHLASKITLEKRSMEIESHETKVNCYFASVDSDSYQ